MEIFGKESILGSSIELGGFECSASQGLEQETLLLLRRANPGLRKYFINALLLLVHNSHRRRELIGCPYREYFWLSLGLFLALLNHSNWIGDTFLDIRKLFRLIY